MKFEVLEQFIDLKDCFEITPHVILLLENMVD